MSRSPESAAVNSPTRLTWPITGVVVAIAVTTTMDATGLSDFSALALLPLLFLFWLLERLSAKALGFQWGRLRDYRLALLYPIVVMAVIATIAAVAGVINLAGANWFKIFVNLVVMSVGTFLVAIVTEEGFFRGWLWASLRHRKMGELRVIICTSVAFALWHISAATIAPDFKPQAIQIPIFLINAAVIGATWGFMRALSGSILVTSASHGLWNGLAYVFFGYGAKAGAFNIANTVLFGPEIGILGLALNILVAIAIWRCWQTRVNSAQS